MRPFRVCHTENDRSKDIQVQNITLCTCTIRCRVVSIYYQSESASEAESESDDQSESGYQGLWVVGNSNTLEGEGKKGRPSSEANLLRVIWCSDSIQYLFLFHSHSTHHPSFSHASIFRRACLLISRYRITSLYSSLPSEDNEPATGSFGVDGSCALSSGA